MCSNRKISLFLNFVLTCFMFSSLALATEETRVEDPSYRYKYYRVAYSLHPDGENVITHDHALQVLKEGELQNAKQWAITFSTSVEKAEVIEAYTLKADGTKKTAPESNYQLEVNSSKDKNVPPAFSDESVLTVVFPDVAVGDTTVLKYRITQTTQFFPKHFSQQQYFPPSMPYDEVVVSVDAPKEMNLQYDAPFFQQTKNTELEGRILLEWRWSNPIAKEKKWKPGAIFEFGMYPGIIFSSFPSYKEIAAAYGERATKKAAVSERIKKLADETVGTKTNHREMVAALYDYVAKNISYAGNCIGVGAVVPRDLDFVLDNKMGDCKDHSTLLQALLAAKGIASSQALVNAGSEYTLPKVPVVSAVNHVINYIPSLDLYVDSTASTMPFGKLPPSLRGKEVILVDNYKAGTKIPVPSYIDHTVTKTTITIAEDGSASGEVETSVKGDRAISLFESFKELSKEKEKKWLEALLKAYKHEGTLQYLPATTNSKEHFKYTIKFSIKELIRPGNAAGMNISPLFVTPFLNYSVAGDLLYDEGEGKFTCDDASVDEEYVYIFPKNVKVLAIPDNVKAKNSYIEYRSDYKQKGSRIQVSRKLRDTTKGPICDDAVGKAYKEIGLKMQADLKSQIVYK